MGAVLSACFEGMLAVDTVWSHGRNKELCFLGEGIQFCVIQIADFNGCEKSVLDHVGECSQGQN